MLTFRRPGRGSDAPPPDTGGVRAYAIGDIHGRIDLLDQVLDMIARDDAARARAPLCLILLGDLIDRGPRSADVVGRAMQLAAAGGDVRLLMGNHEEVFLMAARGDAQAARFFRRIGGVETLASYGLDETACAAMDDDAVAAWMLANIPRDHVDFIARFANMTQVGDYLFVHAGIRPRVPLEAQSPADLRWIRDEFLRHRAMFDKIIVHGHSITADVDARSNRIGIDTGAYFSDRLTAIGLEGPERWFLQTGT
ncbi:MAG: metallophosphoesterase [Sphingobium sp.]